MQERHGHPVRLILEKPQTSRAQPDISRLFDGEGRRIFVCGTPGDEIVRLLSTELGIAEVIAGEVASDLYRLVTEAAADNAALPVENRRRISTTEVERTTADRCDMQLQ